jgi:hypothetical protein
MSKRTVALLALAAIALSILVFRGIRISDPTARFYLLSTIAQSLAAIIGLGLATALVLMQVLARYTPSVRLFLTRWSLAYLGAYLVGVGLALFGLPGDGWAWTTEPWFAGGGFQIDLPAASLWWASACLLLLPNYLLYLAKRFTPQGTLQELGERVLTMHKHSIQDKELWASYGTLALNAIEAKDPYTFRGVLDQLSQTLLTSCLDTGVPKEWYDTYPIVPSQKCELALLQVRHIADEAIGSQWVFAEKCHAFGYLGVKSVMTQGADNVRVACLAVDLLDTAARQALREKRDDAVTLAINQLVRVSEASLKNQRMTPVRRRSARALKELAAEASRTWDLTVERDQLVRYGVNSLGRLGNIVVSIKDRGTLRFVIDDLGELWEILFNSQQVANSRQTAWNLCQLGRAGSEICDSVAARKAVSHIERIVSLASSLPTADTKVCSGGIRTMHQIAIALCSAACAGELLKAQVDDAAAAAALALGRVTELTARLGLDSVVNEGINGMAHIAQISLAAELPACPRVASAAMGTLTPVLLPGTSTSENLAVRLANVKSSAVRRGRHDVEGVIS